MAFFLTLTQWDFELLPIVVLDPDGIVSDPTVHNSADAMCCHARQCSAVKSEKHIKSAPSRAFRLAAAGARMIGAHAAAESRIGSWVRERRSKPGKQPA